MSETAKMNVFKRFFLSLSLRQKIFSGFAVPLISLIVLSIAFYRSSKVQNETADKVSHTNEVIADGYLLAKLMMDMETAQRGFLITGNDGFLEPMEHTEKQWNKNVSVLKNLVSDNPPQVAIIEKIDILKNRWRREVLEPEIKLRREIKTLTSNTLMESVEYKKGKKIVDQIRKEVDFFVTAEKSLMKVRVEESNQAVTTSKYLTIIGTITAVLFALFATFILSKSITVALEKLIDGTQKITDGDYSTVIELEGEDEMVTLAAAFNKMTKDLNLAKIDLQKQRDEMELKNIDLETAQVEIERKAEDLKQSSQYKTEFLANMSHELRTPLNSLLLLVNHLKGNREDNLNEEQLEDLTIVYESGFDLLTLINDIMDLSKVEAGKLGLQVVKVDLGLISNNILKRFKPTARQTGLKFSVKIEEDAPKKILTDPLRMEQVLNNFLSNAFKFTEKGSVTLRIHKVEERVWFSNPELEADKMFGISVIDTGIGVSEDKQEDIFEAFQQEDGSTDRKYGGTGLGLSISRELADLLGGEIVITSKKGEGSTFTLYIPNNQTGEEDGAEEFIEEGQDLVTEMPLPPVMKNQQVNVDENFESHVKILIVDDDVRNVYALMKMFKNKNATIVTAKNGQECIDKLNNNTDVDLILMDIMMPVMSGYEAMEIIRQSSTSYSNVRIIAVTANAMDADKEKCLACGANDFSAKPVEFSELMGQMKSLLTEKV